MRKRTQRIPAALLGVILLLGMMMPTAFAESPDLSANANTVTIGLTEQNYDEDLVNANLQADFYLVANANAVAGYETYSLSMVDTFAGEASANQKKLDELIKEEWSASLFTDFADTLLRVAKGSVTPDKTAVPDADGKTITADSLNPGMYLVLLHSSNLEKTEDIATGYLKTVNVAADGEAEKLQYRTRALSPKNEYLFAPLLITVPGKVGDDGAYLYRTSDPGTWVNRAGNNIKASREIRRGDLEIIKNVEYYEDSEEATFVFNVIGEDEDGNTVYRNVAVITLNGPGSGNTVLHGIPVGTIMTVSEVEDGAHYKLVSISPRTTTIVGEHTVSVSFTNNYTPDDHGGHGLANVYKPDDTGGWTHIGDGTETSTPNDKPLPDAPANGGT